MMDKKDSTERTQIEIFSLEDLVPTNHLVRKFESIDPVVLIKIAMIQYIFGIPSYSADKGGCRE